ncbi:hypothetical protein GCM10023322_14970 [Rugosimonospora acidiphila]|uniref:Glycosyltransferase RgtA/B/C/D-like domain-containing protein n=1 Tax=Rugosimonospora acidiphila TaxID=556531 RepID=A0ABP9RN10_9ACTN
MVDHSATADPLDTPSRQGRFPGLRPFVARTRATWSVISPAGWALLAVAFVASQVSTYLNRALWISDSRLYLAWAYRYLGYSETAAAHRTAAHLRGHYGLTTCGFCWPAGYEHSFFHGDNGAVVGPRVLYPLLSAPFVGLFGPNGMLVVPVLSYAVGVALLALLAARLWGRWWGVAAGAMVLLPPLPSRFGLYALTDATALAFTVAGMLCLPLGRRTRRRDLVWFAILLELGLFTRQFAVTITAGILLTWFMVALRDRRVRNPWLPFAVLSSVLTVASLVAQSEVSAHLYGGDSLSLTQRYQRVTEQTFHTDGFAAVPRVLRNMVHVDYHYVRSFDLLIIVILVFALISAVWRFRSELSIMLIGMSASTLALAVLIVDPTYFRYFVPVVPLMVLCVLALIFDLTSARGGPPSRSTEAVPGAGGAPAPVGDGARAPAEPLATIGAGPGEPARVAGARWRQWLAWVPGPPLAGWALLALMYLLVIYVMIARSPHQHGYKILALVGFTAAVPAIVILAARRGGAVAGAMAGIALTLSAPVASASIAGTRFALALLAIIGCLAMLPGGWGGLPRSVSLAGFGVALAVALAAQYRSVIVVVGVLIGCLAAATNGRGRRWAPYGLIALVLGVASVLADLWLPQRRAQYPHSWFWNSTGWLGRVLGHLAKPELTEITADRVFLGCCVLTLAAAVLRHRREWSWMAAGTLVAGLVLVVLSNRTDQLSYLTLAFPSLALVAVDLLVALSGRRPRAADPPGPGALTRVGGRRRLRKTRTARVTV